MLIYRICRAEFAKGLNTSGLAGRWNHNGQRVLYASSTRSLAALEQLANRSGLILNASYSVMIIEVPDSLDSFRTINPEVLTSESSDSFRKIEPGFLSPESSDSFRTIAPAILPPDWQRISGYGRLQDLGSNWYNQLESLLLRVPSVLVPQEQNYLINTQHQDFTTKVKLVRIEDFNWDNRLGV